jgi:hypothetical protein
VREVGLIIGPAQDGRLLELGVVHEDERTTVVHSMDARSVWTGRARRRPMPLHLLGADGETLAAWFESEECPEYMLEGT